MSKKAAEEKSWLPSRIDGANLLTIRLGAVRTAGRTPWQEGKWWGSEGGGKGFEGGSKGDDSASGEGNEDGVG